MFKLPFRFSFLILLVLLSAGCLKTASPKNETGVPVSRPLQIKLASFFPGQSPIQGESIQHLANLVLASSAGALRIKIFDPGKLVASMEILDAVSNGKVDAGFSSAGFWMGKIPASPLFSAIPFGPDTSEYLAWFYAGNGMKLYQEMYDRYDFKVKILLCAMSPPETSGWFSREIKTAADLKGLKIRFFGLGGRVMEKMGASVEFLPPAEIFPALEKGVIDATEFAMPSMDEAMGLYKIAKYNYFPGWHQQASAFELLINKDVWNKLSPARQAIIELACRDTVVFSIARGEATQSDVMIRNEKERGVKNVTWPPALLQELEAKWREVAEEESAADPFFRKVYADYSKFREKYAVWGSKAYLPRPAAPKGEKP